MNQEPVKRRKVWTCKIGKNVVDESLPPGADEPMRLAVQAAYQAITGEPADFTFSGWNAELTDAELRVLEQAPSVVAVSSETKDERRQRWNEWRANMGAAVVKRMLDSAVEKNNEVVAETAEKIEVARLRDGVRRFYVAWGPHLPPSWREHFEELLGEKAQFGLREMP